MAQATVGASCDFDVERGPDWLFVRPRHLAAGTPSAGQLAEQVWSLVELHLAHRLVLELDDLDHLDAQLANELIRLEARMHGHNGMLRVCGLSESNRQILRKRDPERRLHLFADREEAVLGRSRPCHPRDRREKITPRSTAAAGNRPCPVDV